MSRRRNLLLASGTLFAWAHLPKLALREGRDPRFLVIILRGALDGLAAVAPVGDPDWIRLRGDKALMLEGRRRLCRSTRCLRSIRQCRICTGFTRPGARPSCMRRRRPIASVRISTARTCSKAVLPASGRGRIPAGSTVRSARSTPADRANPKARDAFAVGPIAPLVVRGPAPVMSWTPPRLPPASDDTTMRLLDLYRHTDPALARVLEERMGS